MSEGEWFMAGIIVQQVGYALGARITGLDLTKSISDKEFEIIHDAWIKHLVLVLPGQHIGPAELAKFTQRFGELDTYDSQPFNRHPDHKDVMVLTNRRNDGKLSPTHNAGQNWHTDLSYTLRPANATSVYCVEKPPVGGDTMFANMYLAYETLSPKMQEFLDGLEAIHDVSLIEGLAKREPEVIAEFKRLNPPVIHPAVRVHPDSGKKALYINERVRQFVGMTEAESKPIIKYLCEHSVSPRFVYRHYWSKGDLVMWDNRCLTHMAVGDYDPSQIRYMIRTSGKGNYYGRLAEPSAASAEQKPEAGSKEIAAKVAALAD
jgi:taurine dioxygenase